VTEVSMNRAVVKKAGPMVIALWKQQWPKSRVNRIPVYLFESNFSNASRR